MSQFSKNLVVILGTLGKDAIVRNINNGTTVANLSLATNERYKPKDSDEWKEITTWIDVVAFNPSPRTLEKMKKGEQFYVEGGLRNNSYESNGTKVYKVEVRANVIAHIDRSAKSSSPSQQVTENVESLENLASDNDLVF
jgi:single-strand DNA-binding protein